MPELKLDKVAYIEFDRRGKHAIVTLTDKTVEVWDVATWKRIRRLALPAPLQGQSFASLTLDDGVIEIITEGGAHSFYSLTTGDMITTLSDLGETRLTYFSADCQRFHFWTTEGLVLRYTKGYELPIIGFRTLNTCAADSEP